MDIMEYDVFPKLVTCAMWIMRGIIHNLFLRVHIAYLKKYLKT